MSCFLASAVYYEEGRYERALKFLDKSINVSKQYGYEEQVNEFRLRYAMIHQNLGYYGNAIRYANSVVNSTRSRHDREQYFYAVLLIFEFLMCINRSNMPVCKDELNNLARDVREPYRLGLYHRLLGIYHFRNDEYSEAWSECENAREIYERLGFEDDVVRVEFIMVMILLKENKLGEARSLIEDTGKRIEEMQSADIKAEYGLLRLEYLIRGQADLGVVSETIRVCEEIYPGIRDANVELRLDAGLFRGCLVTSNCQRASVHFRRYYEGVKRVVSNLPGPEYVDDYLRNKELISIVDSYKKMKSKNPGRSTSDRPGSP